MGKAHFPYGLSFSRPSSPHLISFCMSIDLFHPLSPFCLAASVSLSCCIRLAASLHPSCCICIALSWHIRHAPHALCASPARSLSAGSDLPTRPLRRWDTARPSRPQLSRRQAATRLLASYGLPNTPDQRMLSRYRSALATAFAPSAAAVRTCLKCVVRTSPAAKIPGTEVTQSSPARM